MIIHTSGPNCQKCSTLMTQGHPTLSWWWYKIKEQYNEAHLSCVWRGAEEQNLAYASGHSMVRWPDSKHNRTVGAVPESVAMDLFRLDKDGKAKFEPEWYEGVARFLDYSESGIEWGGDFTRFKDYPHFQLNPEQYTVSI